MRSALPLALLAASLFVIGAGRASAQGSGEEREARDLFARALQLLDLGHHADARDLLLRSIDLAPNPATGFNLAMACRGTGELLRAEGVLEGLLAQRFGAIDGSQAREVRSFLAEVQREIARLSIEVRGAEDAEVRVDGRLASEPITRVDPGDHVVVVSAPDRRTQERRVRVAAGASTTLSFELEPTEEARVGTLVVDAAAPAHELEIEGVARGLGHLEEQVPPGSYVVRVRAGERSREVTLSVRARSQTRYLFDVPGPSLAEEPAFWIVGSVILLLLAGSAVGLGVGLTQEPAREPPMSVGPFGVVIALGM